jgi:hypothetical protein
MEYVYSNNDGMVLNNVSGGTVFMQPGDVWFADDPFVVGYPHLFSTTPLRVQSTQGRVPPPPTPLSAAPATEPKKRSEPYYAKAKRA